MSTSSQALRFTTPGGFKTASEEPSLWKVGMKLTPERDDRINFWPVYSDLVMVMVLLLLLFVLTQFARAYYAF